MKALLLLVLAAGCVTAPAPKRPEESHRVPVNRTVPPEADGNAKQSEPGAAQRQPRRAGEVEWR
jgi:hypothetical protein